MAARRPFGLEPTQISALIGVVAAAFLAVIVNVLAARHYARWDVTTDRRFTLSDATRATLRELPDPVQVWVHLGDREPLLPSVRQLLVAYGAETTKLDVRYVDPDKDAVLLEDVRKRFRVETGRTEGGHVVTDAIVVVASGDRHWFLTTSDMVEVTGADDARVRPREEQAFTHAIRQVISGEKARLCFTSGHGELSIADHGDAGIGALREILEKDNYEVVSVDTTEPNAFEPFKGCGVVVVAAPRGAFSKEEETRLRTYLLTGGNLLAALGPLPSPDTDGFAPSGLATALGPFGITLDDDIVVEPDPGRALPEANGVSFFAEAKEHPVTEALVRSDARRDVPRVLLQFARSMRRSSEAGAAAPLDLLTTSATAFGLTSVSGAAGWRGVPSKRDRDLGGPLVLAMASERAKTSPSAPRGPRVVVFGSSKIMEERNLRDPLPLRGAAIVVENAIAWLAARPVILDVPAKASVPAGLRMTDASRSEVRRYVLVLMPLAAALIALAIALRRRSTEGGPR